MSLRIPYELIALAAAVVLAAWFTALSDAGRLPRLLVAAVVAVSLLVWWFLPGWLLLATLLQVGAALYVLLWIRVDRGAGS